MKWLELPPLIRLIEVSPFRVDEFVKFDESTNTR